PWAHLHPRLPKDLDHLLLGMLPRELFELVPQKDETGYVFQRLHFRIALQALLADQLPDALHYAVVIADPPQEFTRHFGVVLHQMAPPPLVPFPARGVFRAGNRP